MTASTVASTKCFLFPGSDLVRSTVHLSSSAVDFYLLAFPRFSLRKKEHKFYFFKNRVPNFRTSRCAGYLLDHSGDKEKGGGGWGAGSNCWRASSGDADDAGVMCEAFGLTVSEAKIQIMYLHTKGTPESTTIFSVETAGQVYNQTNEFVYLGGTSTTVPTYPLRSTSAYATTGVASGSTPSNCTTDQTLPSSSEPEC